MRHLDTKPSTGRPAFTLVELLVVIAIIGTLVGLLLPAVQSARESARNNNCKNHMRNMALAMTQFDSTQGELPGYVNALVNVNGPKNSDGAPTVGRRASWLVMLFPHLENGALWDEWSVELTTSRDELPDRTGFAPELEIAQCPSDPAEGEGLPFLSYVVNAGQAFDDDTRGDTGTPVGDISATQEVAANGVFFDRAANAAILPTGTPPVDGREIDNGRPSLQMSLRYITANDGASKTMLISENLHAVYWVYDGVDTTNPNTNALDESRIVDDKHLFGFTWHNEAPSNANLRRINGAANELTPEGVAELASRPELGYPSSQHPGGVNVAFADGRVVYINDNIVDRIYAQLMTSNRKRSKYFDSSVSTTDDDASDRKLGQPADNDF